jgi:hypothetical protein
MTRSMTFREYVPGSIWLGSYAVRMAAAAFEARTTLIRCDDGGLVVHSPGPLDDAVHDEIASLGPVRVIVAPGNFHHLHVAASQRAFPEAETWICPGVERKRPALRYDRVLGGDGPAWFAGVRSGARTGRTGDARGGDTAPAEPDALAGRCARELHGRDAGCQLARPSRLQGARHVERPNPRPRVPSRVE